MLRNRLVPRWGQRICLGVQPLEIEQWPKGLKREESLQNPTLDRMRRVMNLVYKHGQRYGLIPRSEESNRLRFVRCKTTSDYEALIITPQQAFALLLNMAEPERTLTLLASSTGLRISECLGLEWIAHYRRWGWKPRTRSASPVGEKNVVREYARKQVSRS